METKQIVFIFVIVKERERALARTSESQKRVGNMATVVCVCAVDIEIMAHLMNT